LVEKGKEVAALLDNIFLYEQNGLDLMHEHELDIGARAHRIDIAPARTVDGATGYVMKYAAKNVGTGGDAVMCKVLNHAKTLGLTVDADGDKIVVRDKTAQVVLAAFCDDKQIEYVEDIDNETLIIDCAETNRVIAWARKNGMRQLRFS